MAQPFSILIADDNPEVGELFCRAAEQAGEVCRVVHDGDACLKALAEGDYQALFLDLIMPGAGADLILREARLHHPTMQVVIISVADDTGLVEEKLKDGAVAYMVKPFAFDDIAGLLRRIHGGTAAV